MKKTIAQTMKHVYVNCPYCEDFQDIIDIMHENEHFEDRYRE